ncbi:MAG: Asp23/Gls24 family envelope stress response protein [Eubacteriaceae bacterium]|nr:Asp23/Gls24 family envelope stress response protein [Eubacteriaceae bacterium]MBR2781417.1 Asp23/Gls24 family envelope stress response protein [Eubacteriaceae bacterium]
MVSEERKNNKITVSTIKQVVCAAAMECFGVVGIANIPGADSIVYLLTNEEWSKGVRVSAGSDKKIHIEVFVILEYGMKMETVCENLSEAIKYNVEKQTGVKVKKVTVNVTSVRVM